DTPSSIPNIIRNKQLRKKNLKKITDSFESTEIYETFADCNKKRLPNEPTCYLIPNQKKPQLILPMQERENCKGKHDAQQQSTLEFADHVTT
ncbi:hypothetical protein CDAR_374141, partial [Caerostris darwini]